MKKKLFTEIPCIEGPRLILKQVEEQDAEALAEMTQNPNVYRLLPTFLFEKKYADAREVIRRLYDEAFRESIILGIYENGAFCGLAEFYGFRDPAHKISIGYRLSERLWGRGIATETVRMMVDYLDHHRQHPAGKHCLRERALKERLRPGGIRIRRRLGV